LVEITVIALYEIVLLGYIHQVNRVNYRNGLAMIMTIKYWTILLLLLLKYRG